MTDIHLKAAVPISDAYASDCVAAFDNGTMSIDFWRLVHDSEPVNFAIHKKTDFIVIRLSCILVDPVTSSVGVIWRSGDNHTQNSDVPSTLVSSELMDTYAFVRDGSSVVINRHYPLTLKLGAYLGAFEIEPKWWFACLRRQPDRLTGIMRHYAFYVYRGFLQPYCRIPKTFQLRGSVAADTFRGFWSYRDALAKLSGADLAVDALATARLLGGDHSSPDVYSKTVMREHKSNEVIAERVQSFSTGITINTETLSMGDVYNASGQVGNMGPGGHQGSVTFEQIWVQSSGDTNIQVLAAELERLRIEMRQRSKTSEDDVAVAAVAQAADAAKQGNGGKALQFLAAAGRWAFDVATQIGVRVAAEMIQRSIDPKRI